MTANHLCVVTSLLLALCSGRTAWSDDPPKAEPPPDPCVTDLTLEKLDNPPERKTKFEVVEEVWKERLVDVKAADQKFVAVIRINLPKDQGAPFDDANPSDRYGRTANLELSPQWGDFIRLQRFRNFDLMNPAGYVSRTREIDYKSLQLQSEDSAAPALKRMLAHIPGDRLPDKEYQQFFANPEHDRLLLVYDPRSDRGLSGSHLDREGPPDPAGRNHRPGLCRWEFERSFCWAQHQRQRREGLARC